MSDPVTEPSSGFFSAAYRQKPPWDIGEAQPALTALFDEYPPAGPALDAGCGTGTLVFALAQRGLTVLGVDTASTAINQAVDAAKLLPPAVAERVEFRAGDALHPSQLDAAPFATIADCGFLHLFGQPERDQYALELAKALAPGGRYYVLGFAFDAPMAAMPLRVGEDELRARFTPERGWKILAARPSQFALSGPRRTVPATIACIERITHP